MSTKLEEVQVLIPLLLGCSANLQAHAQQDQPRSWPFGSAARLGASSVEKRSDASYDWAPGLPLANLPLVGMPAKGTGLWSVAQAGQKERSNIIKASFLIPLTDNSGRPFKAEDFAWLQNELVTQFGGWSLEGTVEGAWRDEDGQVYRDRSYRYSVATSALEALRELLREAKIRFGQASLYLEVSETRVEFLYSPGRVFGMSLCRACRTWPCASAWLKGSDNHPQSRPDIQVV